MHTAADTEATGTSPSPVPDPAALPLGARVEGTFLLLDVEARSGDAPHTLLTLANARGRIRSAPIWPSEAERVAGLVRGQVVRASGTIGAWRERRQLTIESIRPAPAGLIDPEDLLPGIGPREPWWRRLDALRAEVRAPRLAALLALFFEDPGFRLRFQQCPASTGGHHARLGGLLQHTCEVAQIGLAAARLVPGADLELLLAGALLHDIGKLESYTWHGLFDTTVAGRVVGHVVLGSLLLERAVRAAPGGCWTEAERLALHHLVLSHHGQLEFGAPVAPMTLEAQLLHHADVTSARADSMAGLLAAGDTFRDGEEISHRAHWQIDHRRLWRPRYDWGRVPDHPTTEGGHDPAAP